MPHMTALYSQILIRMNFICQNSETRPSGKPGSTLRMDGRMRPVVCGNLKQFLIKICDGQANMQIPCKQLRRKGAQLNTEIAQLEHRQPPHISSAPANNTTAEKNPKDPAKKRSWWLKLQQLRALLKSMQGFRPELSWQRANVKFTPEWLRIEGVCQNVCCGVT